MPSSSCVDCKKPTGAPTPSPVVAETIPPTKSPTKAPTPEPRVDCLVDVKLDCSTDSGIACDQIQTPSLACSVGSTIDYVEFTYTAASCDPSGFVQGTEGMCTDISTATDGPVTVQCTDMTVQTSGSGAAASCSAHPECAALAGPDCCPTDDNIFLTCCSDDVVVDDTVLPGGTVTVSNPAGGPLPDKILCFITEQGADVQELMIDTSGSVRLDLQDDFGALTLKSCAPDGSEISCSETICYDAEISNIGTVEMTVTVADFMAGDQLVSVLPDLPVNPLAPGEATSLSTCGDIDVCAGTEISAMINVEANPPSGDMCQKQAEYVFVPPMPRIPPPTMPPTPSPSMAPSECVCEASAEYIPETVRSHGLCRRKLCFIICSLLLIVCFLFFPGWSDDRLQHVQRRTFEV